MVSKSNPHATGTKAQWVTSVRSIFPSMESLADFEKDNPGMLELFLPLLKKRGIIASNTKADLETVLQPLSVPKNGNDDPGAHSFEDFLQNNIGLSLHELASRLNQLIEQFQLQPLFNHKKIGTAMFSRLKSMPADTTVKRNYLRILAFYMGWHQGEPGLKFHYEKLLDLCASGPVEKGSHGIRIGFSIDVIDINAFNLLRKTLKTCLDRTPSLGKLKIITLHLESMFAVYIDIPNALTSDRISDVSPYRAGIRDAVALAHQLLIKWQLSPRKHFTQPNLTIGIMAGKFSELTHLRQLLSSKHQTDYPQIKLTKFTKKCLNENNVRATLSRIPDIIQIPNELPIYIWTVEGVWSWIYLQFPHDLIQKPEDEALESICLPNQYRPAKVNSTFKTAVQRFYQNTQNALLGMELAKAFYYRKDYAEALEVLNTILREDPQQLNALTLKMTILFTLAASADDPERSELQFERAEDIAMRILQMEFCHEEDAFTEIGMGRLGRAVVFLRRCRHVALESTQGRKIVTEEQKQLLIGLIRRAEKAFIRGTNSANTGHRSLYYLLLTRLLLELLRSEKYRFTSAGIQLEDPLLFQTTALRLFQDFGWLPDPVPGNGFSSIEKPLMDAIHSFGDSVQLQSYKANTFIVFSFLLHDFELNLQPTPENQARITAWLAQAATWAEKNKLDGLYIYTDTRRWYGELLTYDEFKQHLNMLMNIVRDQKNQKLLLAGLFN